jgi:hypothetical protein
VSAHRKPGPALELGAGSLNHLEYEDGLEPYDVVEPLPHLCRESPASDKIRRILEDYGQLAQLQERYARIFSIAVLEHLEHLPRVIAQCGRLLSPGGIFQAGIPSEGGTLWGLSWRLTTGLAYRWRTGLDYGIVMRHEHINSADEILQVIHHYFRSVKVRRFPLPSQHLSLYAYIEATDPRVELCANHDSSCVPSGHSRSFGSMMSLSL